MRYHRPQPTKLHALILGVFLLCVQSLALAHVAVHNPAGEPELCATCSLGSPLEDITLSGSDPGIPISTDPVPLQVPSESGFRHVNAKPWARGPPQHS